jgi:phage gp29-like protein
VASDARQICASITRDLVWPLAALNYGIQDRTRSPRFVLDTSEAEDYEVLSKSLPVFVSLGARIPRWWLHEKTGIPEAAESEEILEAAAPVTPEPAAGEQDEEPKDDAPLTAKLATTRDEPDAVDAMVDQLGRDASPLVDAMLAAVRRELVAAPSLEAARDRLEALYPELNRTNLSDLFASAFVAAELSGMDEARQ